MRTVTSRWEVLRSDRADLIYAAVDMWRYRLTQESHAELLPCEQPAYEAAMKFLTKEFTIGASKTESHIAESIDETTDDGDME